MHWQVLATTLQAEGTPSRKARAINDTALLASFLAKQSSTQDPKYMDLAYMSIKVGLFVLDKSPVHVPCVVCSQVPQTEWPELSRDALHSGLHCAAHKAEYHSVCELTFNCCDEPYYPDRDYELRAPSEPQE
jgi:hypothetical protein